MFKKYRKTLIITTIITLLPMLAGVILWNKLPEQFPIHFNAAGEVEMLNVGVKNPSDPIEQIADIIERSPEIIARVKALLGKDKTEE